MGGSGGGGGGTGGGVINDKNPEDENIFECGSVYIKTHIPSPNRGILNTLKKGDVLSLHLLGTDGPIQLLDVNGQHVGNLSNRNLDDLIRCMNQGYDYEATVTEILGGKYSITIT